jgi:hypothetical protein
MSQMSGLVEDNQKRLHKNEICLQESSEAQQEGSRERRSGMCIVDG